MITGQLRTEDINQIMDKFQGPLNQKWLHYLPISPQGTSPTRNALPNSNLPVPFGESSSAEPARSKNIFQEWEGLVLPQDIIW